MTLGSWQRAALVVLLGVGLAACGDDDGGRPALRDAGTDGGGSVGSDGGGGTETDAGGSRMCTIAGGECDVIAQVCADPTHGCYVLSRGEGMPPTTLCDTAGTGTDGMACANYRDCAPGFVCDPEAMQCRKYCCEGRNADCPTGQVCIGFAQAPGLGICDPPSGCTVVPQGGCEDGEGCFFVDAMDGTTDCRAIPANSLEEGATCGTGTPFCRPNLLCVGQEGGSSTCEPICRLGMTDCTSGTCSPVQNFAAGYGVCL